MYATCTNIHDCSAAISATAMLPNDPSGTTTYFTMALSTSTLQLTTYDLLHAS